MKGKNLTSRRSALKGTGAVGALTFLGSKTVHSKEETLANPDLNYYASVIREKVFQKVFQTPFIDTHEHLIEEKDRLSGTSHPEVKSDDWTMVFSHYIKADMISAGMSQEAYDMFFSPGVDPLDKWALLEPYWPAVKNTGYGQAVSIALRELYDVDALSARTIKRVQSGYEKVRRRGFYKYILCDLANIESCQVNSVDEPFKESDMPTLLMQDLAIVGVLTGLGLRQFSEPTGIELNSLSNCHKVIDWWFDKYGKYAVSVKSQHAYFRDIDYEKVAAEEVEAIFKKTVDKQSLGSEEAKMLEDHLFWYMADKATEFNLPIKLHMGYYNDNNCMPLSRLINNPGSATDLCRMAPEKTFVLMHICYPYYEEMISIAKQYSNAYMDMCWAWIVNPIASKDFLKKYLVTAPANKILTFGGDYTPVEPVLGHATIARRGIALALSELVEEGWMSLESALETIDPIMHGNARRIFNLAEKAKVLKNVRWG